MKYILSQEGISVICMKKLLFLSTLFLVISIPFHVHAENTNNIYQSATEYDYPPFSVTSSGEANGFSVDLLKAVAQEMGFEIKFKIDDWATLKQELADGKLDVLPLVGYTEERDEVFDFSVPYIIMHGNIFIRTDNTSISTESDLYGKEIIVMQGDNAHEYAERMGFSDHIITTKTYQEAFELLASGKHDAVLAQSLVGTQLISELGLSNITAAMEFDSDGETLITTNLSGFEQKFCFAVKEGDKELLSMLNEGLAIVSANGTFNELYIKWFPFLIDNKPSSWDIIQTSLYIILPLSFIMLLAAIFYTRRNIRIKTAQLEKSNKAILSLEAHMRNQQKLESIGTLASGVAHEINNPINGVLNYGQIILDNYPNDEALRDYANEIIRETNRVAIIVRNLLQFSRDEKQRHSYANIEDIINSTASLIRTIIQREQITLDIDIPRNLPQVKCRSQQIQQVIMNLLTNARDALNEKYKKFDANKLIQLSCEQFIKEDRNWIRVIVEDHGNGIPESIQDRILDPFFTTKSRDKGTGLGLSISYGIVEEHHGKLSLESKAGEYTKFYLDLPCDNGWNK